jgi:predicted ATPase
MWLLGYPDAAMSDVETILQSARHIGHASTLMYALFHVSMPEILSGKVAAAEAHGQELLSLADEKVAPLWRAHGIIIRGRTLSMRGQTAEGAKFIETGLNAFESTGATHFKPIFLAELAHAYWQCGDFEKAKNYISEALKAVEKTKERWAEAEILRTAGELLLGSDDLLGAEVHFTRSLSLAREQHAKSWELRTATSLARLWHDQGRRSQALDLLAPLYGWFTEGFDTADLMRAKLLLDELY